MSHEKAIFDGVRTRLGVRKSREMTLRIHRLEEGADRGRREVQRSDQERCHLGASDGIARTVQGPVQSATQGDALVGDGVDVGGVNAGDVAEGADSPKRSWRGSLSAWHPNRPLPPQRRMQMATDDDFPVDDLPLPKPGKSRGTMTATERVAQGGVAPPPQVVVDLRQEQSAAGVAVEEGDDTAKSGKQDRPKAKTARKRGTQTATGQGTPATGTGACVVTVPSSLSARIKSDPRPKANLLRAAFETHAPAVVSAHPPRPTPAIEGMQPTMVRREADEGDPFVDVLFKLRVNEKELLDEWVAQTTLTRSGFVTELLVLELE